MLRLKDKRGQNTLEYALLIGVVVAALIGMQVYMKKGIQGKLKEGTDEIGKQFDPTTFNTAWKTTGVGNTSNTETRVAAATGAVGGNITTNVTTSETVTKNEYEDWGTAPAQHY